MARPALLITGFGPFPGVRRNPTAVLAHSVAATLQRRGVKARALVLETSYRRGLPELMRQLEKQRPRAVLMLGLAARSQWVRVERYARDRASPLQVDATGATPTPTATSHLPHRATASLDAARATLQAGGLRARLSPSAGAYLCNAAYALALRQMAGSGVPVLFIHIPWPRGWRGKRPRSHRADWRPAMPTLIRALTELARQSLLRRMG